PPLPLPRGSHPGLGQSRPEDSRTDLVCDNGPETARARRSCAPATTMLARSPLRCLRNRGASKNYSRSEDIIRSVGGGLIKECHLLGCRCLEYLEPSQHSISFYGRI